MTKGEVLLFCKPAGAVCDKSYKTSGAQRTECASKMPMV